MKRGARSPAELFGQADERPCKCGELTKARCRGCGAPVCHDFEGCQLPHRLAQRRRQACPGAPQSGPVGIAVALAAALGIVSCATAPAPPRATIEPAVDVESLLPPPPPPILVPDHLPRFDDMPVRTGRCPGLPPGILVSQPVYAEMAGQLAERKRLQVEVGVLHRLRREERAEAVEQLAKQQAELAKERRWSRWRLWSGVAIGAAAVLAGGWAVSRVSR